eukprot:scaffold1.g5819.t1
MQAARMAALRGLMQALLAAVAYSCPTCGGQHMVQLAAVSVLYIGLDYRFNLDVPRWACCAVGCEGVFAPCSFTVGCFPATPKAGWDVAHSDPTRPARWLDLGLLQLLDMLIFAPRSPTSVYAMAAVVHRQHELNGCADPLGLDHFRRQLGDVLAEYGYLDSSGPGCPLHSINIDFNFGLVHLFRCGTAHVSLQPPNQEVYPTGEHVQQLLQGAGTAEAAAEAERACSDFDAASAVGRKSDKVSSVPLVLAAASPTTS